MVSTIIGIILFAICGMILYIWGYIKQQREPNDLRYKLYKKAEKIVIGALKRNETLSKKELSRILENLKVSNFGSSKKLMVQDSRSFTKGIVDQMIEKSIIDVDYSNKKKEYFLIK